MGYDSAFLYHEPCSSCGSSDANSVYSDGHSHCFSCGKTVMPNNRKEETQNNVSLIKHEPVALNTRKLTKKTCEFFHYGVGQYQGSACQVEDFWWKGKRVAQHLRLPDKDFRWIGDSKKVELWGQSLWKGKDRILVITEGAIDAMSIGQITDYKLPVVSLSSGIKKAPADIKRNLEWITKFNKVVLAFDNDEPGREGVEACVPLLPVGKAYTIDMGDFKDANEMLLAGEGGRLAQLCYAPDEYRPGGVVSGGELWKDLIAPYQSGIPMPFPSLQRLLDGMRRGKLYMFTAGSGIGKSTLVRQLGYDLLTKHGRTVGVMALEDSRQDTAKMWASLYLRKDLLHTTTQVTEKEYKAAYDNVLNCGRLWLFDHWGSTQIDNLLNKINYMAVSLGVEYLILDHISIVVSGLEDDYGDNERRMIDKLMTKLRSLIDSTGITVLAVVHLKRKGGDGKSFNEGRQVSLTDLRGSGSLEQLSDVVIAAERDQQNQDRSNIVTLRVLKNRPARRTGEADLLQFNLTTTWLEPYEAELHGTGNGDAFDHDNDNTNDF